MIRSLNRTKQIISKPSAYLFAASLVDVALRLPQMVSHTERILSLAISVGQCWNKNGSNIIYEACSLLRHL